MMQPPQKEWEEERVFSGSGWIFLKFNRPVYGFRPPFHLATFLSCHDLRFFCKLVYSVIVSFHDVFYALRVEKGISFFATPLFFFFFFFSRGGVESSCVQDTNPPYYIHKFPYQFPKTYPTFSKLKQTSSHYRSWTRQRLQSVCPRGCPARVASSAPPPRRLQTPVQRLLQVQHLRLRRSKSSLTLWKSY